MSLLQAMLSPVARDFWIGRTFVHRATSSQSQGGFASPLELCILPLDDLRSVAFDEGVRPRADSPVAAADRMLFAAKLDGRVIGLCSYGFGQSYVRCGGFYDLVAGEAELMEIFTAPSCRGRGVATRLLRFSAPLMHSRGFSTLFAKVWHSNRASTRAFRAADWTQHSFFVRVSLRGSARVWHSELRAPRVGLQ
jgi:GNAT superfamily N-acetyltransferase